MLANVYRKRLLKDFQCLLYVLTATWMMIGFTVAAETASTQADKSQRTALKKALLLGDEVMFAYGTELQKLLAGKVNCTLVKMPKHDKPDWKTFSAQHIDDQHWDVIHFSYGRELMIHVDQQGKPVVNAADGKPLVAPGKTWEIYKSLINTLRKSGAFLIGCTTTPVSGSMPGYVGSVDWTYGGRFQQLLGPNSVKINDLGDYTRTRLKEMVQNNSNLPTKLGKQLMAEQVASSILEALNEGLDPTRPRVLLVGDSITGGYYGATRDRLAGQAVVYSGGTTYNDPHPDWKKIVNDYIEKGGARGWDIIQFNWGLHAVKYVDKNNANSEPGKPGAHIQFSPKSYAENLENFVAELKRTQAKLVFATTTPVPSGAQGSIQHLDLEAYNGPAKAIMAREGIVVNDLFAFATARLDELQIKDNVHFTAHGSDELAKQNVNVLLPLIHVAKGKK